MADDPVRRARATLLRLPLYVLGAAVGLCFPRDRNLWVFGRKAGVGDGPWALLRAARTSDDPPRIVWLAHDEDQLRDAEARGVEAHLVSSARGRWLTLRAGVLVLGYGLADVYRPFAPGAHIVQTWHGSPLKLIHLDETTMTDVGTGVVAGLGRRLMGIAVRWSGRLISTMPAGSPEVARRFTSAWRWRDADPRVVVVGDPRCDHLHAVDEQAVQQARNRLAAVWGDCPSGPLVLYAPTWRDGDAGPEVAWPTDTATVADWDRLDITVVLRAHPFASLSAAHAPDAVRTRVRSASSQDFPDLNEILPAFDVLVTDYSAAAIDFACMARPQLFFAPDLDAYARSRGFYEPYAVFTGDTHVARWPDLWAKLREVLSDNDASTRCVERTSAQLLRRYHAHTDGRSAQRLYALVRSRTAGHSKWRASSRATRADSA